MYFFDASGEICNATYIEKNIEKITDTTYELKNEAEIVDTIKKNNNVLVSNSYGDTELELIKCEQVLYSDDSTVSQEYMIPYYKISAKNSNTNEDVEVIMPALKDKYYTVK